MSDQLRDVFAGMGQTADEVASFLAGHGITGVRDLVDACPVAEYLHRLYPGKYAVVGSCHAQVIPSGEGLAGLPPAVKDFISRFDAGAYPALVRPA